MAKLYDGRGGIHYIRWKYGDHIKIGGRVSYEGRKGTITGTTASYIIVRPDERRRKSERIVLHPTDGVTYLTKEEASA